MENNKSSENLNITLVSRATQVIKAAIVQSQARSVQLVNQEMLALYYGIGRYVSNNSRNGGWGTGVIDSISKQLKAEMPGLKGFSSSMLKRMRTFYEAWEGIEGNSLMPITEIANSNDSANSVIGNTELEEVLPMQLTGYSSFPLTAFLNISFSHHSMILRYCKDLEARKYYIQITYDQRLKVEDLEPMLKADLYSKRDNLPNNFFKTIPDKRLAMKTLQMLKDQYVLDYINVEDIDASDSADVDERVIETKIVMNIKNFIMTFGRSFSYMGNQVHYDKLGHDHWIDLLFFNRELKSLVVIELKKGAFKPSYLGQLSTYLRILDDDERLQGENPSVGLILCKSADKAYVEYVIQDYPHPMGVATYQTKDDIQSRLDSVLPPKEEMLKLLEGTSTKEEE